MSDEQFAKLCERLGDFFGSIWDCADGSLQSMTMAHWGLIGVGLVVWAALMMRGMGLKKF